LSAALTGLVLVLAGCGQSVARGGENAAEHPALGYSASTAPPLAEPVSIPSSTPPHPLPAGLTTSVAAIKAALSGGCWENAHQGNVYGAYDQLFWWYGQCADTVGDQVTVELYPSAAKAKAEARHPTPSTDATAGRYLDGAVLVDVYSWVGSNQVTAELAAVKDLRLVRRSSATTLPHCPGYPNCVSCI
jgi:hypothetical protein